LAGNPDYRIALVIAAIMGILCAWQYQRLSGMKKPIPNEVLKKEVERRRKKPNKLTNIPVLFSPDRRKATTDSTRDGVLHPGVEHIKQE
jgi:hypothetical protein